MITQYPVWLIVAELKFMWKNRSRRHKAKSPIGQYNTIVIYNFGLSNYKFNGERFVNKLIR